MRGQEQPRNMLGLPSGSENLGPIELVIARALANLGPP
jgi:hypothetical protein